MSKQKRKEVDRKLTKWFLRLAKKWRVVVGMIAVTVALMALLAAWHVVCEVVSWCNDVRKDIITSYMDMKLRNNCNLRKGNIYQGYSLRPLVKDIDEVIVKTYDDTVCIVRRGERYAFFNLNRRAMMTPFAYSRAWPHNGTMAVVVDTNGWLRFLDQTGTPVPDARLPYHADIMQDSMWSAIEMHSGICALPDENGKAGLVDMHGRWVVEPSFDNVRFAHSYGNGYWELKRGDSLAVADTLGKIFVPLTAGHAISVTEGYVLVHRHNLPEVIFSEDGSMRGVASYRYVSPVAYDDVELGVFRYITQNGDCGLLDSNGHLLTGAFYSEISAISPHLMIATLTNHDSEYSYANPTHTVVIDTKGNIVEK
ncbi:MAG: WG repeat-containing protein [Bacteroidales bacterium]|nr:WG repeat-containing protein [Bacteroidales bacterium]